jgi:hypothetical protein
MINGPHTNYGLAGGLVDDTDHVLSAERLLCFPSEISKRQEVKQRLTAVAVSSPARRNRAESN